MVSEVLDVVDRFANDLLGTVVSKTKEVLALLLNWHDLWEVLKYFIGLFGMALVGGALFYLFFANNPNMNWLEFIPAFVGMVLLSVPLITVVVLGYVMVAGIAMLTGGILLKIIVILGKPVKSVLPPVRSEGERR